MLVGGVDHQHARAVLRAEQGVDDFRHRHAHLKQPLAELGGRQCGVQRGLTRQPQVLSVHLRGQGRDIDKPQAAGLQAVAQFRQTGAQVGRAQVFPHHHEKAR